MVQVERDPWGSSDPTHFSKAVSQPGSMYQPNRSLRAQYSFNPILSFGRSAIHQRFIAVTLSCGTVLPSLV